MAAPRASWSQGMGFLSEIPVTKVILIVMALGFILSFILPGLLALLAYAPFILPQMLVGLVTYPLVVGGDLLGLLFGGLMIWMFGGSLERSWGPRAYIGFLLVANALAALVWTVGVIVFIHNPRLAVIAGPWLMVSTLIVAWAWLNPEETINIWFVLPVKAKWVGWATIILQFFIFPSTHGIVGPLVLLLGFFALGGVAVAYAVARYHRDWAWILRPGGARRPQPSRRVLRHPSGTVLGRMMAPVREWQRRRRIAYLEKTFRLEDDVK